MVPLLILAQRFIAWCDVQHFEKRFEISKFNRFGLKQQRLIVVDKQVVMLPLVRRLMQLGLSQDNALRFFEPKGTCTTEFPLAQVQKLCLVLDTRVHSIGMLDMALCFCAQVGNITVKPVKKGPEDKKRLIIEFKQSKCVWSRSLCAR